MVNSVNPNQASEDQLSGIAIIVEFEPLPGQRDELSRRVRASAAQCLREDGCLRMEVFAPDGAEPNLVLSELWRDEAALAVHREQPGHEQQHAVIDELCRSKRVLRGSVM